MPKTVVDMSSPSVMPSRLRDSWSSASRYCIMKSFSAPSGIWSTISMFWS